MKKLAAVTAFFIVALAFLSSVAADTQSVDNDLIYAAVSPQILSDSDWINFNFTSKAFGGNIDVMFGFNEAGPRPTAAQLYNPHIVTSNHSFSCDGVDQFYNTSSGVFYCWQNSTEPYTNEYPDNETIRYRNITWDYFDHSYESVVDSTVYWTEASTENWTNINPTGLVDYSYGGMNKWYYRSNVPVTQNQMYQLRVYMDVPFGTNGKYYACVKPSSESISTAIANNHFLCLDPWWNSTFLYKLPVYTNTSSGTAPTGYQYNFSIGNSDVPNFKWQYNCSDVRFVNSAETAEIPYYLEDCNNASKTATFTIKLDQSQSTTPQTYYMYYGSSSAIASKSSGADTYDLFDEFNSALNTSLWTVGQSGCPAGGPTSGMNSMLNFTTTGSCSGGNYWYSNKWVVSVPSFSYNQAWEVIIKERAQEMTGGANVGVINAMYFTDGSGFGSGPSDDDFNVEEEVFGAWTHPRDGTSNFPIYSNSGGQRHLWDWNKRDVYWSPSSHDTVVDDIANVNSAGASTSNHLGAKSVNFYVRIQATIRSSNIPRAEVDWVKMRKWGATPKVTLGSETGVSGASIPSFSVNQSVAFQNNISLLATGGLQNGTFPLDKWWVTSNGTQRNITSAVNGTNLMTFQTPTSPGMYNIQAWANDTQNNVATSSIVSLNVTSYPPTFLTFQANQSVGLKNNSLQIIAGIQNGTVSMSRYWFTVGGTFTNITAAAPVNGTNTLIWTANAVPGNYSIVGYVNDTYGMVSSSTPYWVYLSPVAVSLRIITPANGAITLAYVPIWTNTTITSNYPITNITQNINNTGALTILDSSILGWYNMDNNVGLGETNANLPRLIDNSQYNYVMNNMDSTLFNFTVNGKYGAGLYMPRAPLGFGQDISTYNRQTQAINTMAHISIWYNTSYNNASDTNVRTIAQMRNAWAGNVLSIYIGAGSNIYCAYYPGTPQVFLGNWSTLNLSQFHNFQCDWNTSRAQHIVGYVDGVNVGSSATQIAASPSGYASYWGIGSISTGYSAVGTYDELVVSNRTWSDQESYLMYLTRFKNYDNTNYELNTNTILGGIGQDTMVINICSDTTCAQNTTTFNVSSNAVIGVNAIVNQNPTQNGATTVNCSYTYGTMTPILSTANCILTNGAVTRQNNTGDCTQSGGVIRCGVNLQYYDAPGTWNVNATVNDGAYTYSNDTTSLTYNTLNGIQLSLSQLTFGTLTVGQVSGATNNPIIVYNQGNVNINNVSIQAFNLTNDTNCNQNLATQATSCGGLSGGGYTTWGSWVTDSTRQPAYLYDGNYSTYDYCYHASPFSAAMNATYVIPPHTIPGSMLEVKVEGTGTYVNISIPGSCLTGSTLRLVSASTYDEYGFTGEAFACWNSSNQQVIMLQRTGDNIIWEQAMWWRIQNWPTVIMASAFNASTIDSASGGAQLVEATYRQVPGATIPYGSGSTENIYTYILTPTSSPAKYTSYKNWVLGVFN